MLRAFPGARTARPPQYAAPNQARDGKKTGIESFIGVALHTANGPYGSLSFSSSKVRNRDFSVADESISMLIAGWIGYLLGNIEQLEFLSSKNDYYQTLLQNVPAMMFLSDANGLVLSATDELTSKIGLKPESAPGMNCVDFFQPDDSSKVISLINSDDGYCLPATMIDKTGTPLDVELSMSIKPSGILKGVRMVVAFDVSERNQASGLVEAQNKRLEIANENLNQYAFIASHDLQEPLRKIQQFGSFLEEDMAEDITEDGRYHLNVIMDAAVRMSALISDLLLYSSATQVEPDMAEVNLTALINDVLNDLDFQISESKADIAVSDLPIVSGNELLLKQLFSNLLSNAIKYRSLERPLKIRVYGIGESFDEGVVVSDNAIGFDMSYAKKIFEPFNRLHTNKEYKGSGIGLAICKTVCDKHKWGLNVASESGKGSKFDISFR